MPHRRLLAALAALLGLLLSCTACVTVKPWDKDLLGRPVMGFVSERPERGFVSHALITNEEAEGGEGGSGGGCGCR